jgi:hypothetical protein
LHVQLQAKSPIIEVLEERLMKAAEDRGTAAAAATDARDSDDLEAAQVRHRHAALDNDGVHTVL